PVQDRGQLHLPERLGLQLQAASFQAVAARAAQQIESGVAVARGAAGLAQRLQRLRTTVVVEDHRQAGDAALGRFHLLDGVDAPASEGQPHHDTHFRTKSNNRVITRRSRRCSRIVTRSPERRCGSISALDSESMSSSSTRTTVPCSVSPRVACTSVGVATSLETRVTLPLPRPNSLIGSDCTSTVAVAPGVTKAMSLLGTKATMVRGAPLGTMLPNRPPASTTLPGED